MAAGACVRAFGVIRRTALTLLLGGLGATSACGAVRSTPITSSPASFGTAPCFAHDAEPPAVIALADRVLLEAADGEALYTLADGLKPLSSGRSFLLQTAPAPHASALDSLDLLRQATRVLDCGPIGAFVHVFTAPSITNDSVTRRAAEVVLYHRGRVAEAVRTHAEFFATLAITPSADVREVLAAVENAPRAARWRGYGLLFGYPDDAVDFFVRAGIEGDSTRAIVPRDFRRIDTYRRFPAARDEPPTLSTFVYAVPKGAPESVADRALREAAAPIYARYVRERTRFVVGDSAGALVLWREWLSAR
jgi:hypothetical protein